MRSMQFEAASGLMHRFFANKTGLSPSSSLWHLVLSMFVPLFSLSFGASENCVS